MQLELTDIGKRFRFDWIFRNINCQIDASHRYAILGPNGAGKSTLMKVLSGHLSPSKGKITFSKNNALLHADDVYRNIAYAAPYIELIEEFTLTEAIDFYMRFKSMQSGINTRQLIDILGLEHSAEKELRFFSSGMKQRLKLALAICSDCSLLLLDEPTTNLDTQGSAWYRKLLETYGKNRTVVIATNVKEDYEFFCTKTLNIKDYC